MKWHDIAAGLRVVAQIAALLAAALTGAAVGTVPLAQVAPAVCQVGAALAAPFAPPVAARPFGS